MVVNTCFFCFKNKCMHIAYCILNSNTYFFWWRYQQKNKSETIDCEMCFMGFNFTVSNADRYVSFENLHDNRSGDSKRWKLLRPYTTRSLPDVQLSLRPTKTFTEISFQFLFCLFYFISWVPSALNRFKATIQAIHCCQFDKLTYLIGP